MATAQGIVLPRARGRVLASRVSTGHVVMVVAGLLGALVTLNVLRTADSTRAVVVAAHELVPGTVIDGHALGTARVHVDGRVQATLFDAGLARALVGQVAVARVAAGALLTHDAVRARSARAAARAMSFPIPMERAVGGTLAAGDRVDVLAVRHDTGRGGYVDTDVEVLAFRTRGSGPLQGGSDATVTLAVDADAARRIVSALEVGTVTLVRSTGARPARVPLFDPAAGPTPGGTAP